MQSSHYNPTSVPAALLHLTSTVENRSVQCIRGQQGEGQSNEWWLVVNFVWNLCNHVTIKQFSKTIALRTVREIIASAQFSSASCQLRCAAARWRQCATVPCVLLQSKFMVTAVEIRGYEPLFTEDNRRLCGCLAPLFPSLPRKPRLNTQSCIKRPFSSMYIQI